MKKQMVLDDPKYIDVYLLKRRTKEYGEIASYKFGGKVEWEYFNYKQDFGADSIDSADDALFGLIDSES